MVVNVCFGATVTYGTRGAGGFLYPDMQGLTNQSTFIFTIEINIH